MDLFIADAMDKVDGDWPDACYDKYERIEVLGKGSFGQVWMARRLGQAADEYDDEYVAIKSILIKDEKGKVYAEREIQILQELRHPNVIRLVHAYPIHAEKTRVVVMQLARGPNLHQLVVKRGALGTPLSRLVSRQLIAAVSYLHGRAVLHRDIKPSNCILALANEQEVVTDYDYLQDDAIWSNGEDAKRAIINGKWKLMLVDFGFARALETEEIRSQAKKMRNSIVFEKTSPPPEAKTEELAEGETPKPFVPRSMYPTSIAEEEHSDEETSIENDMKQLESMVIKGVNDMRKSFQATNPIEEEIFADDQKRKRHSGVSLPILEEDEEMIMPTKPKPLRGSGKKSAMRRISSARQKVRSMSALGTKAYAAPEIRKQLRQKTEQDFSKANAAMTECVADYGMIVDAYSVGWTLRVAMTGVPPHFTISEYMAERENVVLDDGLSDDDDKGADKTPSACCCCAEPDPLPFIKIRDPASLPAAGTLLITRMTEKKPENRMTVREAQNDPWIAGQADDTDPVYNAPVGDYPSKHGDPVVPLKCAKELSEMTVEYHMQ